MTSTIDTFKAGWGFTRGLTYDFISCVPDDRWKYTPHPAYAPFCKQVRHMVGVQGVYIDCIRNRVADFGAKHSHYDGPLERESLVAALREKDAHLDAVLEEVRAQADDYVIEFYGTVPLAGFLGVFRHHEALHHGQWSLYATLGGFETPQSWKLNWGL